VANPNRAAVENNGQSVDNQSPEKPEALYWPQLDGLRALAFFLVFLEHQSPIPMTPQAALIPGVKEGLFFAHSAMRWGWVGVDIFFVLSAFLITTLLLRERAQFGNVDFPQFFLRRILRIWPLYFLTVLLGFGVLPAFQYYEFPWGSLPWQGMVQHYLPSYLLFLGNFKQAAISGPPLSFALGISWSVAMEEQFYLVWGLMLTYIRNWSALALVVFAGLPATLLLRLAVFNEFHNQRAFYFNTWTHLDPILMGAGLALLGHAGRLPVEKLQRLGPVLFALPVFMFLGLVGYAPPLESSQIAIVLVMSVVAVGAGLLLLALLYWAPAKRWFSNPAMIWAGRLSFGLYLFHPLGKDLANVMTYAVFGPSLLQNIMWAWGFYFLASLLATTLMAWLSWHLMEKRFNRLRKRFMRVLSGGI
jgi:peptidoglycan/LPS O-acetylase OafA/YrhL